MKWFKRLVSRVWLQQWLETEITYNEYTNVQACLYLGFTYQKLHLIFARLNWNV